MKILAIIPARGGSKEIPLKNITMINNKPLIYYTIGSALKAKIFDYVTVSTDNQLIKNKCKKFKKIIVFDRGKNISKDNSKTEDAVFDVLKKIKIKCDYKPDWIFILEPTSPLRSVRTIVKMRKILNNARFNSILTIKKINNTPATIVKNRMKYIQKRVYQRQKRKKFYEESSTIYCVKYNFFIKQKKIVEKNPYTYLVSKREGIDINDLEDLKIASQMLKSKS